MRIKTQISLMALVAIALTSCGIHKTAKDTYLAVETSNQTQQELLRHTRGMQRLMERMKFLNEQIELGIHRQTLSTALELMLSAENTQNINPPYRMLPFAKTFAAEATELELVEVVHVFLQEARFASRENAQVRRVSLAALSCIAGFTSMEKMKGIFKTQVEGKGRYEETAYAYGLARYNFVRDVFFSPLIDASKILNVGSLPVAADYFRALYHLSTVPFVDYLTLHIPAIDVIEAQIDPTKMRFMGRKAKRRFERELSEAELEKPEVQALLSVFDVE